MPFQFACEACGKKVQAAEAMAGTKVKCPHCAGIIQVPTSTQITEEPALVVAAGSATEAAPARERRPCPKCGELIMLGARKCRFCDEIFDDSLRRASPSIGDDPVARMLLPVGRSLVAIAAGYAGLFAVTCVAAPLALILGIWAIIDLKKHPEKHGMGRAVFGLVMGIIFSIPLLIVAVAAIAGALTK